VRGRPKAGQNEVVTYHFDAAIKQIILRDRSDQVFDAGGQIEVHHPIKLQVTPNTNKGDSWTAATSMATTVGMGRLKSSVGGESTLMGTKLGGGVDNSPRVR